MLENKDIVHIEEELNQICLLEKTGLSRDEL